MAPLSFLLLSLERSLVGAAVASAFISTAAAGVVGLIAAHEWTAAQLDEAPRHPAATQDAERGARAAGQRLPAARSVESRP